MTCRQPCATCQPACGRSPKSGICVSRDVGGLRENRWLGIGLALLILLPWTRQPAVAQPLLEGEFGDIDLGRELVSPGEFPTISQLRQLVREPEIRLALMFKLYGDENHHHLPIWSHDGQRLAFQRRNLGVDTSKLCLFNSLSQQEPTLLTQQANVYDYMFRWGMNSPSSFVFARIQSAAGKTQILFSPDGTNIEPRTSDRDQCFYPALYERTDGMRWLAYEHRGQLIWQSWMGDRKGEQVIASGTTPRWSRDGQRLLIARKREGGIGAYDIVIHYLGTTPEIVLASTPGSLVRSPVWSPDETRAAWFQRDGREGSPWHISVSSTEQAGAAQKILAEAVINSNYKSEGPSWEPSGRRLWCFSHDHRQQEYYPLVGADVASGATVLVDYPNRYTSPNDLAVNPVTRIPEFAFTARDRTQQDLFVTLLNHY